LLVVQEVQVIEMEMVVEEAVVLVVLENHTHLQFQVHIQQVL
jgi:hypothetical protein